MATRNTNTDAVSLAILGDDEFSQLIIAQEKLENTNKNWKDSELNRLQKELDKKLSVIDNACKKMKEGKTDNLVLENINLHFKLKKNTIKSEYAKLMEPLRMTAEQIGTVTEIVATNGGEKVGNILATPVKATVGFLEGVARKSGLNRIGNIFKS